MRYQRLWKINQVMWIYVGELFERAIGILAALEINSVDG